MAHTVYIPRVLASIIDRQLLLLRIGLHHSWLSVNRLTQITHGCPVQYTLTSESQSHR